MNPSSLFSFEESSEWDPKAIVKHLIVPQDVLTKLNSIPGWTKVQENQNILRLDNDFSILSSQSECHVNFIQSNLRIEKNLKLFDEETENRKSLLETYKGYRKKLTRSLSFFTINKSCGNLFNDKTLKQSSSLQNLCQLSDTPDKEKQFKNFTCVESAERHSLSDHSEPRKNEEISSKGLMITEQIMETVTELPVVNISTPIENATLHAGGSNENSGILATKNLEITKETNMHVKNVDVYFEASKETNGILAAKNSEIAKENNDVLHVKNVDLGFEVPKESNGISVAKSSEITKDDDSVLHVQNVDLHSDATNENNGTLHIDNADLQVATTKKSNGTLHTDNANLQAVTTKESNGTLHTENAGLQAVTTEESNSVLFSKNADLESNNISDELIKHGIECSTTNANGAELHSEISKENGVDNIDLHSKNTKENNSGDNVDLHSENTKENNSVDNVDLHSENTKGNDDVLPAANSALCSSKASDELAGTAIKDSVNIDNFSKVAESYVPTSVDAFANETAVPSHGYEEKVMETTPSNYSTVDADVKIVVDPKPTSAVECFVSSVTSGETVQKNIAVISIKESNVTELCHSKSSVVKVPTEEFLLPNKEAGSTYSVANSVSDMKVNDVENDKVCDPSKSSTNDDTSMPKKRKLESRNKRSKRRRSEEKHGNLKIRSIKKVGEIRYTAEEVKTMLEIMEQLL